MAAYLFGFCGFVWEVCCLATFSTRYNKRRAKKAPLKPASPKRPKVDLQAAFKKKYALARLQSDAKTEKSFDDSTSVIKET